MDFNSILIGSADPDRMVEYYTRLFGDPAMSDGGYTGWQLGSGFVTVGPHSEVTGKNVAPGRLIWNLETTDVRADFDRLKAAGGIVIAEPYGFEGAPPDTLIATFADPDDNYFQLMSPMAP
jgi:predicted enzyme related to lactoylglutathione lyase